MTMLGGLLRLQLALAIVLLILPSPCTPIACFLSHTQQAYIPPLKTHRSQRSSGYVPTLGIPAFLTPWVPTKLAPRAVSTIPMHPASRRAIVRVGRPSVRRLISPRMEVYVDPAAITIKVRLIMLRSPLVDWYNGPDKHRSDVKEIQDEFRKVIEAHPKWQLRAANETGVYAVNPSGDGELYDVEFALLGLGGFELAQLRRDVSYPNEPFIEFALRQMDCKDTQMCYQTSYEFTEWIKQYGGLSWTSRDVPASGLGGLVMDDNAELDQRNVVPPTSCAALQKADPDLDRPCLDTSGLIDWLLPQLLVNGNDDDLGVAGTTPQGGREEIEGNFGVTAIKSKVPTSIKTDYEEEEYVEVDEDGVRVVPDPLEGDDDED